MMEAGRKSALLDLWMKTPNQVLTTILIGNNLVNILASSLATGLSYDYMQTLGYGESDSLAIGVAVGVMTLVILIFGEVAPKTFAKHNPERLIPLFIFVYILYYILLPLTIILVYISRLIVFIGRGKFHHDGPLVTEEDLEWMIRRGTQEKSLDNEVGKIMTGALDLDDTVAREIMVPRTKMVMFEVEDSLDEIWAIHKEHNFSRYPIYEETPDTVVGIFYMKDLLTYIREPQNKPFSLKRLMRPDPYFIPETKNVGEILAELKRRKLIIGIVIDEFGGLSGMLTLEDILEEMVGEIYDEYDDDELPLLEERQNCFRLQAELALEDLQQHLHLQPGFPEDRSYDTVGGLLMDLAGKIPQAGEVIVWPKNGNGEDADEYDDLSPSPQLHFTVISAEETRINEIRLELHYPDKENATE